MRTKKEVYWGPEIFQYFWRLTSWIVGPLSESKISGSGFFYLVMVCGNPDQVESDQDHAPISDNGKMGIKDEVYRRDRKGGK